MSLYPAFDAFNPQREVSTTKNDLYNSPYQRPPPMNIAMAPAGIAPKPIYPVLTEYMGLDLAHNIDPVVKRTVENYQAIPLAAVPGQVTNGIRRLTLCKDNKSRVGLMVSSVNNGVFVCFVLKSSPAAIGGLRFGDQILQINETLMAGMSAEKVHHLIRKLPANDINFIIRDRPYERTITLQRGVYGFGFEFKKGRIDALMKDSSAARNGLVVDHQLLEIQGQNVIGMSDKEIDEILKSVGPVATFTIMPVKIYDHMMRKMKADYVKAKMDHTSQA